MLKFDFNNMMKKYIGADGLTEQDLAAVAPEAEAAFGKFAARRGTGMTEWADLPYTPVRRRCARTSTTSSCWA